MAYSGSYGAANNQLKLGIWYRTTDQGTKYKVQVEIWLNDGALNLEDSSNELYFDVNKTSATTYRGSFDVNLSSKQEMKLVTYTYTYTKTRSAQKISCAAKMLYLGSDDRSVSVTNSFTVPALESHTVRYDANGGLGAPDPQTKWYGTILTLSGTELVRDGYTFQGWGISTEATAVTYAPGDKYGADEDITLYAVWEKNTDVYVKRNGKYVAGMLYVKKEDRYVRGTTCVKHNGTYKMGV